jgi:hypothetical protein
VGKAKKLRNESSAFNLASSAFNLAFGNDKNGVKPWPGIYSHREKTLVGPKVKLNQLAFWLFRTKNLPDGLFLDKVLKLLAKYGNG